MSDVSQVNKILCRYKDGHPSKRVLHDREDALIVAEITRLRAALADERKRALEEAAALCHSRANDMLLLKSTEMAIANNLSSHFMERHNWYCDLATDICALKEPTK